MEHTVLWIWLTTLPGITAAKISALLEVFDSVADIFAADAAALCHVNGIACKDAETICAHDLTQAEQIYNRIQAIGAWVLTYEDARYPASLRNCIDVPYVLYGCGEILNWDRLFCLTVVGTRDDTDYGREITRRLAYDLAQNGVTVVGGMARGIDTVGHKAALAAGGKTIAVLGSGIDVIYPKENRKLYAQIIKNGAVLTDYIPGTKANGRNFPRRNRIMAALSSGVLVTEAPSSSGSLITANWALEMGKDIFAVPGDYDRRFSQGCNHLIQKGCAKLVGTVQDILEEYPQQLAMLHGDPYTIKSGRTLRFGKKVIQEVKIELTPEQLSSLDPDSRKLLTLLSKKNMHFDELCKASEKDAGSIGALLTMLEIQGYVDKLAGNNYAIHVQ